MEMKQQIKQLATKFHKEVIGIRQYLHKHPELSNKEIQTAAFIEEQLTIMGIPFQSGIFENGIIGLIEGKNPTKKVIALRADMDALAIQETNKLDYTSVNDGVMHACGHDVHISCLLGAAKILNELKSEFEGSIKLIFQPAEELIPGGAKFMIEEGALENPIPDYIFGQHVYPELDAGKIGIRAGKYMASTDEINLLVKGKGGHAAMPYALVDPVLIASQIIIALQQIVSRNAHFNIPTVLSFGEFLAKGTYNVIPDTVSIKGTFRTLNEDWRKEAHKNIKRIAKDTARAAGGDCEVFINKGYPFLVNDTELSNRSFQNAIDYLGEENVIKLDPRMTGEDFAYFAQKLPSCFYRLGVRNKSKGINSNLHTSTFNIDESSLKTGMGIMAWFSICELNN